MALHELGAEKLEGTLWKSNIAMEITFLIGKSSINGPFSIAILVYWRVSNLTGG
jgi:hypothetical protein